MSILNEDISLIYWGDNYKIGEIKIDALLKESHELSAEISEHPTESGESFADHVQNLPLIIKLEGIISNTPMTLIGITALKSLNNFVTGQANNLAQKAYDELEAIFYAKNPISISTSLKDYDNMVLQSLSINRDAHSSSSLHFSATAKQIRMVKQAQIQIPKPKKEHVKAKKDLGQQETKIPSSKVEKKIKKVSFLKSMSSYFGGVNG